MTIGNQKSVDVEIFEFGVSALKIITALFTLLWILVNFISSNETLREVFFNTYWLVIIPGLLIAIAAARVWGGIKSTLGRALTYAALGLAAQLFGQITFSILHLFGHEQYPSIADIGYFGSITLYFLAAYEIAHAAGARAGLKSYRMYGQVFVIPLVILYFTINTFVQDLEFDNTHLLKSILDFGYPIGQSMYLIMAILALTLSKSYLGGLMRNAVMLLCISLFIQYLADAMFLYRNANGTWVAGGISDLQYMLAYFFMGLSVSAFYRAYKKLYFGSKSK